jgi:hypothetical protein
MKVIAMIVVAICVWARDCRAQPEVKVQWASKKAEAVTISISAAADLFEQCLKGGLQVRYRYELELCRHRILWSDHCAPGVTYLRSLKYEAVSDSYQLSQDRLGDRLPAEVVTVNQREEALARLLSLKRIELKSINDEEEADYPGAQRYLSLRVLGECKGEYSATFGLLRISGFDTGWVDYQLVTEP